MKKIILVISLLTVALLGAFLFFSSPIHTECKFPLN